MQNVRRANRVAFRDSVLNLQPQPRVERLRRLAQELHVDAGILRLERFDDRLDRLLLEDPVVARQMAFLLGGLIRPSS